LRSWRVPAGGKCRRPPTGAALLLDGLWRLKPRRGQPLVDMGGSFQLAYFLEQPVLPGTLWELGDLRLQPGFLGGNSIFKGVRNGSATLHDTTSCLRVLTVGFAGADPNMPSRGDQFRSEHSQIQIAKINLEHGAGDTPVRVSGRAVDDPK
jgi:hypothetical protein